MCNLETVEFHLDALKTSVKYSWLEKQKINKKVCGWAR